MLSIIAIATFWPRTITMEKLLTSYRGNPTRRNLLAKMEEAHNSATYHQEKDVQSDEDRKPKRLRLRKVSKPASRRSPRFNPIAPRRPPTPEKKTDECNDPSEDCFRDIVILPAAEYIRQKRIEDQQRRKMQMHPLEPVLWQDAEYIQSWRRMGSNTDREEGSSPYSFSRTTEEDGKFDHIDFGWQIDQSQASTKSPDVPSDAPRDVKRWEPYQRGTDRQTSPTRGQSQASTKTEEDEDDDIPCYVPRPSSGFTFRSWKLLWGAPMGAFSRRGLPAPD